VKRLGVEHIRAWPASKEAPAPERSIDWDRPFAPEAFTQLYFTPAYPTLSLSQRLRYTQLFGLRINEQFQVFESGFTVAVMARVMAHQRVRQDAALRQCIEALIEDERRHDRMFRHLNRAAAPGLYARRDTYFTRLSTVQRVALWLLSRAANDLVPMVWFILLVEEYSNALSRAMLSTAPPGELGPLEPAFVAIHRRHLQDEARHVHVDANLLDVLLHDMPPASRQRNARWLHRFLREVLAPKHVGKRVVDRLVHECPELSTQREWLQACLKLLEFDPVMAGILRDPERSPLTHAMIEAYPEFHLDLSPPAQPEGRVDRVQRMTP
jgi:hypothetical protein